MCGNAPPKQENNNNNNNNTQTKESGEGESEQQWWRDAPEEGMKERKKKKTRTNKPTNVHCLKSGMQAIKTLLSTSDDFLSSSKKKKTKKLIFNVCLQLPIVLLLAIGRALCMCSWCLRCYWVFIFAFKQTEGDVALHILTPRLSVQSRAKRLWRKKEKGEKTATTAGCSRIHSFSLYRSDFSDFL